MQTFKAVGETNIKSFLTNLDIQIKNDGQAILVKATRLVQIFHQLKWLPHMLRLVITVLIQNHYALPKVTTRDGQEVTEFKPEQKQAMKDSTCMITDVLKDSFKYG